MQNQTATQHGSTTDRIRGKRWVHAITDLSDTTIWRLEKAGKFPKRIQISPRRVGWLESGVLAFIAERQQG